MTGVIHNNTNFQTHPTSPAGAASGSTSAATASGPLLSKNTCVASKGEEEKMDLGCCIKRHKGEDDDDDDDDDDADDDDDDAGRAGGANGLIIRIFRYLCNYIIYLYNSVNMPWSFYAFLQTFLFLGFPGCHLPFPMPPGRKKWASRTGWCSQGSRARMPSPSRQYLGAGIIP